MLSGKRKLWHYLLVLLCVFSFFRSPASIQAAPATNTSSDPGSIHFLTLNANDDAILIECNGKFGMVDSGEDSDYPNGSDPRYPSRSGTTIGQGQEQNVIAYLHSLGVNSSNFEFYIGTHPHSDHIGSADEIIREFHPKRVYIEPYKDSYISNPNHLWDNLYVYDHMVSAAKETGATLIQYFDKDAPLYPETVSIDGTILCQDVSETLPATLSVTLTWTDDNGETQSRILSSEKASDYGTLTLEEAGKWTYQFNGIPKYNNNKDIYDFTVTPAADGYTFSSIEDSAYDFLASSLSEDTSTDNDASNDDTDQPDGVDSSDTDSSENGDSSEDTDSSETPDVSDDPVSSADTDALIAPESLGGITDEELPSITSGETDSLITSAIAAQDLVTADNSLDPANVDEGKATAPAQSGIHDNSTGSISTPTFYLGGENGLLIEIRNYGVYQSELKNKGDGRKIDANYFSLGVKVTSVSTGKTAFLSGDINNYLGVETSLAKQLGHIDLLKLGHHGSYGSNTNSYVKKLNPKIAVLTGTFNYVTNDTLKNECGTLDTLLQMANRGTALYVTSWYTKDIPALVFRLDNSLTHNTIPSKKIVASSSSVAVYYSNGFPASTSGWKQDKDGNYYYFSNSSRPLTNRFLKIGSSWYYLTESGKMATGWVLDNGTYYYMDSGSGKMKTGWLKVKDIWYYLTSSGKMVTGAQTINNKQYYFTSDGAMVASAWANNKYYGSDGVYIPNYKNTGWRHDSTGYWYQRANGSYPKNAWEKIDGKWYYFNNRGYMVTGWLKLKDTWYYLNSQGAMVTGWQSIGNTWYYFSSSGAMRTGWKKVKGSWYYFASSGAMYGKGWHTIKGKSYYMYTSGSMASNTWIGSYYVDSSGAWIPNQVRYTEGWVSNNGKWWYRHSDGDYTAYDWESINGKWYYFGEDGWMQTEWLKLNGSTYYLGSDGAMVTGWQKINGFWYYFDSNGAMLGSGWPKINNQYYYMYKSGAMASNTWIGSYYVNASGVWIH